MAILLYFLLTFIISWGGILLLGIPHGMPATQEKFNSNWPIVFIPYLLGPIISCIFLTGILYGKKGYKETLSYFRNSKFPLLGYIVCIFFFPLIITAVLINLSIYSKDFIPVLFSTSDKLNLVIMGLSIGLFGGGLLEEAGWTGFATPKLINKFGYYKSGTIIGFLWGAWHILPTFWGSGDIYGDFDLMLFLPPLVFYIGVLPAYRLIIVWSFMKHNNIIVSILMHMSLTASTLFILAPRAKNYNLIGYYMILTVILWTINIVIKNKEKNLTTAST